MNCVQVKNWACIRVDWLGTSIVCMYQKRRLHEGSLIPPGDSPVPGPFSPFRVVASAQFRTENLALIGGTLFGMRWPLCRISSRRLLPPVVLLNSHSRT